MNNTTLGTLKPGDLFTVDGEPFLYVVLESNGDRSLVSCNVPGMVIPSAETWSASEVVTPVVAEF